LELGVPQGAAALASEPGVASSPLAKRRHVEVLGHAGRYSPSYTAVRR
jgi:hypothetical protein